MPIPVLKIVAKAESDLVVTRYRTRQLAKLTDISKLDTTRLVTAVSEITRNAIRYAGEARIEFNIIDHENNKQFLQVVVIDQGKGLDESAIAMALGDGKMSGISASHRLVDDFKITSTPGTGTRVELLKVLPSGKGRITPPVVQEWIVWLKDNSPFSVVEDLEQQNKQLIETLDELEKYRQKLEEKTEQLNQANKYKAEFLANMSHEIRTPMNAVIGMSNILDRTELSPEQKRYIKLIKDAGTSLLDIINDILDFSKIEAGKLTIETIEFEFFDHVETCVELLSTNAHSKDLSLHCWIDPELPAAVYGDSVRLRQVLVNLINNAIKFTKQGEVTVRVRLLEDRPDETLVRFEVIDSGIGLSEEQRGKLFKPFVQADGSTTRKFGGTGLGLSISKQLIDLMKGQIGVESVLGAGSTFWFELPFGKVKKEPVQAAPLHFKRALIVDDHRIMRELAKALLNSWDIDTSAAGSGAEALKLADSEAFDLFILDYKMEEMDGLELTAKLRASAKNKYTPIVLLTALHDGDLGEKAIASGCNAFLTKPLRQRLLFECLSSFEPDASGKLIKTQSIVLPPELLAEIRGDKASDSSSAPEVRKERKAVLLVEDNPTNQIIAEIELKALGCDVTIAGNGEEALTALAKQDFALAFMDCQMPILDGYETTKRIRVQEAKTGKHLPIIAMTANAMAGDRENCLAAGMDSYISKPFDPKELKDIVEQWLLISASATQAAAASEETQTDSNGNNGAAVLDVEMLGSRFNPAQIKQLLTVFVMDTESKLPELKTYADDANAENVTKLAHNIKGAAAMIFAEDLAASARELEHAGRNKEPDKFSQLYAEVCADFAELKSYVQKYLSK